MKNYFSRETFRNIFLSLFLGLTPTNVLADYSFSGPGNFSTDISTDSTDSSFSINKDSMSCSSGGGSAPSMWVGVQGGNSDIEGGNLTANQADDFLQAGLGFTIPLGSPGNKGANCNEVMAILEAEEFIKMIQLLSSTGAMDPEKTKNLLVNFMDVIGKKLGVDIKSAMKSEFIIETKTAE
tara:strand:- start:482 stop:1024 length:543 start_codon:yes stop_codon:yes gene_type:complete